MSNNNIENQIISKWESEKHLYLKWGELVKDKIINELASKLGKKFDTFIKIPIEPRLKDNDSLIAKALYRNKNYNNPYDDITDKVGLRVVLLLNTDTKSVEDIIVSCDFWDYSLDRNFEEEKRSKPYEFNYQSIHCIVRPSDKAIGQHSSLNKSMACEVQIRTILQHAYAELTHDTIYKPNVPISADIKRAASKSMALIEASGDYFETANNIISTLTENRLKILNNLSELYYELIGNNYKPSPLSDVIITFYYNKIENDTLDAIRDLLQEKPFVIDSIKNRANNTLLFREPIILLLYLITEKFHNEYSEDNPISKKDFRPIYNDLGIAQM